MKNKTDFKWVFIVTILAFVISIVMTLFSTIVLENVGLTIAVLITLLFIFLGIIFDIIGVAVTAAVEVPFRAMAAKKVKGAKESIILINNADKVSSIIADILGDICGILSGAAGAVPVLCLYEQPSSQRG